MQEQFDVFVHLPIYTHLHWISSEFYINAEACLQKSARLVPSRDCSPSTMIYDLLLKSFQTGMFFILSNTKVGIVVEKKPFSM